jgi:hypothetical protein
MVKWAIAAVVLLAQAQAPQDPNLHYDKTWGFSLMKPPKPKAEEWDIKAQGVKFSNSQAALMHKVDDVLLEIFVQEPAGSNGLTISSFDPKKACEDEFKNLQTNPNLKEGKKKGEVKSQKMAGANAWYIEMSFKDKDDKPVEWRLWTWLGRENQCLYKLFLITGAGLYEKYAKEIGFILGQVKTYKLQKK